MNPEQWLSLKWNGGSTMSDRWLNQSKIIHCSVSAINLFLDTDGWVIILFCVIPSGKPPGFSITTLSG